MADASIGSVILEARGLTRAFTGVVALRDVDFTLRAGEVHAVMGQNGAGKSTLVKVLTGVYPADGGELRLGGEVVRPSSPLAAQRLGCRAVIVMQPAEHGDRRDRAGEPGSDACCAAQRPSARAVR